MICFPLDNTGYEAVSLGAWCGTRTRGVSGDTGHYDVTANGDMTVTVSPGLAWVKADTHWGVNAYENEPQVITLDVANGALSRIDAVCVRLDKNRNEGELIIKTGATSPQPPVISPPVRDLNYDEIYIATVEVRAGTTSIRQSDITDQRLNENYCGIMRDGITGIPTQQLHDQWAAWLDGFTEEAQAYYGNYKTMLTDLYVQFSSEVDARGEDARIVYDAFIDKLHNFEISAKNDFDTWFETIRDILNENVAGNLQNQISELQERLPKAVLGIVRIPPDTPLYPRCELYETEWACGVGGAGLSPAGGGRVKTVETDIIYNEYEVTVYAPAKFADYTRVSQVSDTAFAFFKDETETKSLILQISN